MTKKELDKILTDHARWLRNDGGTRANLVGANLSGAELCGAELRGADLRRANLSEANLSEANLRWAELRGADLREAKLRGADIREADLSEAKLRGADLRGADLRRANLSEANLSEANLRRASLREANLREAGLPAFQIPQHGTLTVWKKLQNGLCKLKIPAKAKRTAALVGRKCRAEYAKVLWVEAGELDIDVRAGKTVYRVGETVHPDIYDDDIRIECTHGIHFFLTREEAEGY